MTKKTIYYDPKNKTCIEIWSEDETLICELSYGPKYYGTEAHEVFKTLIQRKPERVQERTVEA